MLKHKFQMRPGFKHYMNIDGEFRRLKDNEVIEAFPKQLENVQDRFIDLGVSEEELEVVSPAPQPKVAVVKGEKKRSVAAPPEPTVLPPSPPKKKRRKVKGT